jgi:restriction system protein
MARKRGFFAEMQYQSQQAAKRQEQAQRAAQREYAAAQREHARLVKEYERAVQQAEKATAAERKRLETEAKQAHVAARLAAVEEMNSALEAAYAEIDGILAATLEVDDYVDLERLRRSVEHPPFPHQALEWPIPAPAPLTPPEPPLWVEPPAPGGLFGKRKHAEQVAEARRAFEASQVEWERTVEQLQREHQALVEAHAQAERDRVTQLQQARDEYARDCAERERQTIEANQKLDELISGLAYRVDTAVQEYVTIVLANAAYPDAFPVEFDHTFNSDTRELTLEVSVPAPEHVPAVKAYKYNKSSDEITSTSLPVKEKKDRYANAVAQVALRVLHEVFEADRSEHIQTIAATIGTTALNPATGRDEYIPLAMVAADRVTYMGLNLANVVPAATLKHLGGVISKNPFDLIPIDTSAGVRGPA